MSRDLFPELEQDVQNLANKYMRQPTVENYNLYKRTQSIHAEKVLTRRANEGVTMAAIALYEKSHNLPKVKSLEELGDVSGLTKDELQVVVAQLKMKFRNKSIEDLTIGGVYKAYAEGQITQEETQQALEVLDHMKRATMPQQINGEITVVLDSGSDDGFRTD